MTHLRVPAVSTLSRAIVCAMLATTGATPIVAARSLAPMARGVPSDRVGGVAASQAPLVAVALRGDIYAVPADGSALPHRLTAYGHNNSPALSPHGRLIAYLSAPRAALRAVGFPTSHNVWIVPVDGASDGSSAYKLTPTNLQVDRGGPAWAPDGQHLAYIEYNQSRSSASVVVVDYQGTHRIVVLRTTGAMAGTISWSPDSRRIAVAPIQATAAGALPLHIVSTNGGAGTLITVRFPTGSLGQADNSTPTAVGSFPNPNGLSWAPDGRHLVVETFGAGEGGHLTGLWRVADSGGVAQLFVGTPGGVRRNSYSAGPYSFLSSASSFAYSPDGRSLLINSSGSGFWLANADGAQGHLLSPAPRACCALVQSVWLTDSSGLAFVTLQVLNPPSGSSSSSGPPIRARLYSRGLNGTSHLLYQLTDPDQGKMEIAPAFNCVVCGG